MRGEWSNYLIDKTIDLSTANSLAIQSSISAAMEDVDLTDGKVHYFNCPMAFDIETSNFRDEDGNKVAIMYIFQFAINGYVFYGRTWKQFQNFLDTLANSLATSSTRRPIIYVYNLAFEFQFMREYLKFLNVFADKIRHPIYAITESYIEFRDAMILVGPNYSLEYVADKLLHTYPIKKLVGNLDYSLIRHTSTPLTANELAYCINDVLVLNSLIQEKIETDGAINQIPLTNTGYVRRHTRSIAFGDTYKSSREYHALMANLTLDTETYIQLHNAFMGGFTHASALSCTDTLHDVSSNDIKSSYPATIVLDYFPMTQFTLIDTSKFTEADFAYYMSNYCCLFDIEIYYLEANSLACLPLSASKCNDLEDEQIFQGRLVYASYLQTTCTELDLETYQTFYNMEAYRITNFRYAKRGRLPRNIILAVLDFFEAKTKLDGVEGCELEYMTSKNMLNSDYGMMVTAIIRAIIYYSSETNKWIPTPPDVAAQIETYNTSYNRFLSYAWGVWVTAHARRRLFTAIEALGDDFVYCDTDSVKYLGDHFGFFAEYNDNIYNSILQASLDLQIPTSKFMPKSPSGKTKMIGKFEYELTYSRFKTIGPKRYIYEFNTPEPKPKNPDDPDFSDRLKMGLTNGGVNTKKALTYMRLKTHNNSETFDMYNNRLVIPSKYSGKLTHTYIDTPRTGVIRDYLGKPNIYSQLSATHLEPQPYSCDIKKDYIKFLKGVGHEEIG